MAFLEIRTIAHHAIALLAAGALSCVLFVDNKTYSDHCAFAGLTSACGKCLASRCPNEVDACCGDSLCGGLIATVESCATSNDASCDSIRNIADSESGATQLLAECLSDVCGGDCANAPPTSSTFCGDTMFGYGTSCLCEPPSDQNAANNYQCTPTDVPHTTCCASSTWPNAGSECECLPIACDTTSDGCSCFLDDSYDPTTVDQCTGGDGTYCCQAGDHCSCGSTPCMTGESQVTTCSLDNTPCPVGTSAIKTCSMP